MQKMISLVESPELKGQSYGHQELLKVCKISHQTVISLICFTQIIRITPFFYPAKQEFVKI